MLEFDPEKRISPQEALNHKWFRINEEVDWLQHNSAF
jgi:hypothetical protein